MITKIIKNIEKFLGNASGLYIHKMKQSYINILKFSPLNGGKYIELIYKFIDGTSYTSQPYSYIYVYRDKKGTPIKTFKNFKDFLLSFKEKKMKKQINEIKRMQQLAGVINEISEKEIPSFQPSYDGIKKDILSYKPEELKKWIMRYAEMVSKGKFNHVETLRIALNIIEEEGITL